MATFVHRQVAAPALVAGLALPSGLHAQPGIFEGSGDAGTAPLKGSVDYHAAAGQGSRAAHHDAER